MTQTEKRTAEILLDIGAVFLRPDEPFTWASGIKSPIYCDNRMILSTVAERREVEAALAEMIRQNYPDVQFIAGTSTAGIGHAALAAELLGLPMGYVRGSAKDHGRNNRIEGRLSPGQKTVVVEDLISTAGSAVEVAQVLREADADVLGIASIFTYGMKKGLERLEKAKLKNASLSNYDALLEVAAERGAISRGDIGRLRAFRDDPGDQSWMKSG